MAEIVVERGVLEDGVAQVGADSQADRVLQRPAVVEVELVECSS